MRLRIVFGSAALLLGATPLAAAPTLEKVVMVSRHGVRAPLRPDSFFSALTHSDWPAWPVGPGEMTKHGAESLTRMADFVRAHYAGDGLLPDDGCAAPDTIAVWSDVADTRTVQSGAIWADRLAPGCGLAAKHAAKGTKDPIFDSKETNACPVGWIARGRALIGAALADDGPLRRDDRSALEKLQAIIAPGACDSSGKGVCLVPSTNASHATQAAALTAGSTLAEGLYLQYEQGFPPDELGWGRANAAAIAAILPLHEHGLDVLRKTPQLAARRGAVLARAILALLGDGTWPPQAQPLPAGARVVMFAGHDSNLLYLAGIMGLDWKLADQPSKTPPDGTLAFELWHDPQTGHRSLAIRFFGQTLAQIRDATILDAAHPPDVVEVRSNACGDKADCEVGAFSKAVSERLAQLCGR